MKAPAELISKVRAIALTHEIPPDVALGLCEHESSWITTATKYEPNFRAKYIEDNPKYKNESEESKQQLSTSFGLAQIILVTAREHGFDGDPESLILVDLSVWFGLKYLRWELDKHDADIRAALNGYNGGSDPHYAPTVLRLAQNYR